MLRTFLSFFSKPHQTPVPIDTHSHENVVLYAYLDAPSVEKPNARTAERKPQKTKRPANNHREWLLSMELRYTKLCAENRCEQLRDFGIVTTGDLIAADLKTLACRFPAPKKAALLLKQYRHAIRFALAVPAMMPRDALLLISIHRRSVRGLAMESPAMLYRDLQRFSESSQGQRLMRGRRLPSMKRLRQWIRTCENRLSIVNTTTNTTVVQALRG